MVSFTPMQTAKNILVCPLDWGLGHATRCIPIINALLQEGYKPIIGGNGRSLLLLQKEFPNLTYYEIPGYNIVYTKGANMAFKIAQQIPKILSGIKKEKQWLAGFLENNSIAGIISDNRFGLYSNKIPTVYISHQLLIKSPFSQKSIYKIHKKYIHKYTQYWIPDFEGENNLSGDLGHLYALPSNAIFIGPLSRFKKSTNSTDANYKLTAILSGPEPQRTILEEKVTSQLQKLAIPSLIVKGITEGSSKPEKKDHITTVDFLTAKDLEKVIHQSELILSRAGYSTIMDLATLGKKAILVPTPGQTEQEYLAKMLKEKNTCYTSTQDQLNIEEAIKESKNYSGFESATSNQNWKELFSLFEGK